MFVSARVAYSFSNVVVVVTSSVVAVVVVVVVEYVRREVYRFRSNCRSMFRVDRPNESFGWLRDCVASLFFSAESRLKCRKFLTDDVFVLIVAVYTCCFINRVLKRLIGSFRSIGGFISSLFAFINLVCSRRIIIYNALNAV